MTVRCGVLGRSVRGIEQISDAVAVEIHEHWNHQIAAVAGDAAKPRGGSVVTAAYRDAPLWIRRRWGRTIIRRARNSARDFRVSHETAPPSTVKIRRTAAEGAFALDVVVIAAREGPLVKRSRSREVAVTQVLIPVEVGAIAINYVG